LVNQEDIAEKIDVQKQLPTNSDNGSENDDEGEKWTKGNISSFQQWMFYMTLLK
nr:hypothetical protein [Tanacetum cinerariifolium]